MEIKLTKEQYQEMLDDKYISVIADDHKIYADLDWDDNFNYIELLHSKNGKRLKEYAFDNTELNKLIPKRVYRSCYYHYEAQCPQCSTMMIYRFDYCPKCGQKLDWSEE